MEAPNTYAELMAAAEKSLSRKEARHLINESTKIMNKPKPDYTPCSSADLRHYIEFQRTALSRAEANANVARQMIEMLERELKAALEAGK